MCGRVGWENVEKFFAEVLLSRPKLSYPCSNVGHVADGEFVSGAAAEAAGAVALHRDANELLLGVELDAMSAAEVAALLVAREVQRRVDAAVDQRLIATVVERNIAGDYGATSPASLLVELLRISPGRGESPGGAGP